MIQANQQFNRVLMNNLFWFVASLFLAFFVWVVAANVSDPIQERRYTQQINVQVDIDPGLMIVEQQTRTARVTVRAQQSILALLSPTEDIVIRANLLGRGPGTYTVELDPEIARRVVSVDTQPRQITVTLEEIQSQRVEVVPVVTEQPPAGYQWTVANLSETQVMITGAARHVGRVVAAQAQISLANQRTNYQAVIRLVPVDSEGNTVSDVTVEPQNITVSIEVALLESVREVPVIANIDIDSIPEGYNVSFTSAPPTVIVGGDLSRLPDVLETERISLANRTADFEITVPIILPSGRLFILGEQQEATVSISISPIVATRAFESVPVTTIGLGDGLRVELATTQVTMFVTGPQVEIQALMLGDMEAVLDLSGLGPGTYDLVPIPFDGQLQIEADNISVSPPTIAVTITGNPEATDVPQP